MAGQATVLANWAQKVGGRPPVLPNRLRRQWQEVTHARVMSVFNSWIVTYEVNSMPTETNMPHQPSRVQCQI